MKKILRVFIPLSIICVMGFGVYFVNDNLSPMTKQSELVNVKIDKGTSTSDIIATLKKKDLIKNEYFMKIYVKIKKINGLQAGIYKLDKSLAPKEIFKILKKGSNTNDEDITITFPEGKNMRQIARIIEKNTTNSYEDVFNLLNDKEYINELISKYSFLDETILNENIYYPLEGYLAPNTYNFKNDVTVKEIFAKLLDQTGTIVEEYNEKISSSNFSVHQILTLASIVEGEGVSLEDRQNIAGVFINRLNSGMSLGSDVTTYYAAKIDIGDRDLYQSEINSDNLYNTRSASNAGKLPIGPICNPSKQSIEAVINYTPNDYYYFVADKNMKVYFSTNDSEHVSKINELKNQGLWYEY